MARDFTKNTSNYMSLGANAIGPLVNGASAISMSCNANFDTTALGTPSDDFFFVAINGGTTGLSLALAGNPMKMRAGGRSVSTDSFLSADSTTTISTGSVWRLGAVFNIGGDKIRVYVNGTQEADTARTFGNTTYTNGTPTTVDGPGAAFSGSAPISTTRQMDGQLSEFAIWNIDITSAGFAQLGAGVSPLLVRPDSLVFYMPLIGQYSPEKDYISGKSGTITGTVAAAAHHRMYYPRGQFVNKWTYVAPAGGFQPAWGTRATHVIGGAF